MRSLILLFLAVAAGIISVSGRPQDLPYIPILQYRFDYKPGESYSYLYESGDKTKKFEDGILPKTDLEAITVKGEYSYVDPDGGFNKVSYIGDQQGFRSNVELNFKQP